MEASERKPTRRRGRRILLLGAGTLTLLVAAYFGALAWYAPDQAKLSNWRGDLESALAEAKQAGKLVVIKAGSKY